MDKSIFWGTIFTFSIIVISLISKPLVPFIIAFILAYLLQPIVEYINNHSKISRPIISYIVFAVFLSIFVLATVILLPIINTQILLLINKIPLYKQYIQLNIIPHLTTKIQSIDPFIADKIKSSVEGFASNFFNIISSIFNNIWDYTIATINLFINLLLVPVILLYLLRDWPQIMHHLENLFPLQGKNKIREILISINNLLSAYIRGQLNICLILAIFYSIGLYLIGVDSPLLVGILSGFLIIIPFLGILLSFTIALVMVYFSYGFSSQCLYLVILYIVGYLMEGYYLTPKIIGERIGLHPLWIIFAVLAGGSVLGFLGIFFAIPIAGIIKILIHYLIDLYKSSRFYKS